MSGHGPASGKRSRDESAARREAYRFWARELVRFADLDINGHVNNIAFAVYAESGRAAFLQATRLWSPDDSSRQSVLAHIEIDYLQELKYPADIQVGLQVLEIGRSSFQLGVGIFSGERCFATVKTVQVRIDARSKLPITLNEEEKRALQPYLAEPLSQQE
jgi:acyl-CoA thioester hydrolase